jgi:adiponectin receptor
VVLFFFVVFVDTTMATTRQRTSSAAAARRRKDDDDEKVVVDEKKNQKKNKKGEGEKTKTTSTRRLGNEQPAHEIETQESLQRDHDEHFEEEHEPFFFGPYAMPCPEERYRKWLCADCPTCKKTDAPLYAIHNTYILSGYRTRNTFWDAFRSIFKKHNETTNIWTHLIGMIFFFTFLVNVKEPERVQMIPETWVTGASAERVLGLQMTQRWRDKVIMVDEGLREARKSFVREKISRMSDSYTNHNNYYHNKDEEKAHSSSSISFADEDIETKEMERSIDSILSASKNLRDHLRREEDRPFKELKRETAMFIEEARRSLQKHQSYNKQKKKYQQQRKQKREEDGSEKKDDDDPAFAKVTEALREVQNVLDEIPKDVERLNKVPRWPMRVFLLGAILCLGCSTCCHTCCNISAQVSRRMWKMDYLGIAILIVASFYPVVYYSFYCLPELRDFYLSCVTCLGVAALIPTILPRFQKPSWTPVRAALFTALASFGFFPWFHNVFFVWKVVPTPIWHGFWLELLMGFCYCSGAYCYALKIPEKYWPGRFDVFGCGHNIFHIMVVAGALVHYEACLVLELWRDHHACEADEVLMRDALVFGGYFGFQKFDLFASLQKYITK